MKPQMYEEFEGTETGVVTTPSPAVSRPPLEVANPFEPNVRTIAATDLPAEAQGQLPMVPWTDPVSSKSGKAAWLPPRPAPAPAEGGRGARQKVVHSKRQKIIQIIRAAGTTSPR